MRSMEPPQEIYVSLLNEGVDVWRPVQARHLGRNVYQIEAQQYDHEVEQWPFDPGDKVVCEYRDSSDGRILVAIRKA